MEQQLKYADSKGKEEDKQPNRNQSISMASVEEVDEETQKKLLNKYDKEAAAEKEGSDWRDKLVGVLGAVMSLYIVITSGFGTPEATLHRTIFMTFCLPMTFMVYPMFKKNAGKLPKWYDIVLIAATLTVCGYMLVNNDRIRLGSGIANGLEQVLFAVMAVCVLEGVRRVAGAGMAVIISTFFLYAYFGQHAPGALAHPGVSFRRLASYLLMTNEGFFGTTVGTVAGMVGLFITFATFMEKSGVGNFINNFALSIAGSSAGGPAKVSVVTSALFGTISGNAVSNVITTGAFTIPLMKKTGYESEFAGAVEAVASTAGQLMPPIMGASAFIMADITGIPYTNICMAAVIPVLMYYIGCFTMVHLRARKLGLSGLTKEELPKLGYILKTEGYLFIPFVFVITMLMIGYTVSYVGFWAIPLTIIIAALKKDTRMSLKDIIECLMKSGKRLLSIGATCCGISMIMGVCNLTGITQTLSTVILNAAGGSFLITLILIAMICIVLGMGMPTVSVYMLLSTVAAPALINGFGIPVLAAHMYVFYFGLMANVTPPVALPAYAAAGLAGSNPNKTGWQALKLALGGFIVPFVFIYSPDILFIGAGFTTAIKVVTALFGILILSTAIEGWMYNRMSAWQRIAAVAAGICFISTGHITDVAGILLVTVIVIYQRKEKMLRSSSALLS